ncbi:dual specificity protein phosphatase 19 isoform X2 [Passer domesticus]|uniref:dual specificity protein phosphatase 19 isoform X2 n=1 Tax=Passer domesticus TaxID=48849 RepID=UPI0030FF2D2B
MYGLLELRPGGRGGRAPRFRPRARVSGGRGAERAARRCRQSRHALPRPGDPQLLQGQPAEAAHPRHDAERPPDRGDVARRLPAHGGGGGGGARRRLRAGPERGPAGSQDAAHDLETMRKHKVTHVLNVAYGVQNAFLNDFIYKTISILDLPETDITSYFPECFEFIEQAKIQDGVVLVHCNAGVSRAAAIVIGFLMNSERLSFARAFSLVKNARPAACPNPGFMEQLHKYQEQILKTNGSINNHD